VLLPQQTTPSGHTSSQADEGEFRLCRIVQPEQLERSESKPEANGWALLIRSDKSDTSGEEKDSRELARFRKRRKNILVFPFSFESSRWEASSYGPRSEKCYSER
jgi:hypothetical protein